MHLNGAIVIIDTLLQKMARSCARYNCTLVGPVLQIYQLQDTANDLISRSGSMCIDLTHKILSFSLMELLEMRKEQQKWNHLADLLYLPWWTLWPMKDSLNIRESSLYEILLMQIMLRSWNPITTAEINTFLVLFFYWLEHKKPNCSLCVTWLWWSEYRTWTVCP